MLRDGAGTTAAWGTAAAVGAIGAGVTIWVWVRARRANKPRTAAGTIDGDVIGERVEGEHATRRHSARKLLLLAGAGFAAMYAGRLLDGAVPTPVLVLLMTGGLVVLLVAAALFTADAMRHTERNWREME